MSEAHILNHFILGDLTPDTDNVFMQAVQGMFLSKVYGIANHFRPYFITL